MTAKQCIVGRNGGAPQQVLDIEFAQVAHRDRTLRDVDEAGQRTDMDRQLAQRFDDFEAPPPRGGRNGEQDVLEPVLRDQTVHPPGGMMGSPRSVEFHSAGSSSTNATVRIVLDAEILPPARGQRCPRAVDRDPSFALLPPSRGIVLAERNPRREAYAADHQGEEDRLDQADRARHVDDADQRVNAGEGKV